MSTSTTQLQNPHPHNSDRSQLECFLRSQDEQAFRSIVERHADMVWGVCRRTGLTEDESEDVFQATFFVLARYARRIRRRNSLASWIYGVACRTAIRAVSERGRRPTQLPTKVTILDESNPLHEVARRDEFRLIDEELNRLPEQYRTPLVLLFLQGRSNSEVARELGISVGAVDGRIRRGKERLRLRLMMRGVSLAALWSVFQQTSVCATPPATFVIEVATASLAGAQSATPASSTSLSTRTLHLVEKELTSMTLSAPLVSGVMISAGLLVGMFGFGPQGEVSGDSGSDLALETTGGAVAETDRSTGSAPVRVRQPEPTITQQTLTKLAKPIDLNTKAQPISDVLKKIAADTGVEIWIDDEALEDAGINPESPVTASLRGLPAEIVLDEVLPPRGLDWRMEEALVIITTLDESEEHLITRVFDVEQLLAIGDQYPRPQPAGSPGMGGIGAGGMPAGGGGGGGFFQVSGNAPPTALRQFGGGGGFGGGEGGMGGMGGFGAGGTTPSERGDWLIEFIQQHTLGAWMQIDGTGGELSLVGNMLIVRQTFRVMRSVEWHLQSLTKVLTAENDTIEVDSRSDKYPVKADQATLAKLSRRGKLSYENVPLRAILADIAKRADVDVLVSPVIEEDGYDLDGKRSITLNNGSYDLLLKLLLKQAELVHFVSNGVLNITTVDAADEQLRTVVFRILDFHNADFEEEDLLDAIYNSTYGPWEAIDGSGGRLGAPLRSMLSVTQNERNLMEVRELLMSMRRHLPSQEALGGFGGGYVGGIGEGYGSGFGGEGEADFGSDIVSGEFVTRFYRLPNASVAKELAGNIPQFVQPAAWGKRITAIECSGSRLVVRQTAAIHGQIAEFIKRWVEETQSGASSVGGPDASLGEDR